MNRTNALQALIEVHLPVAEAIAAISKFQSDADEYLAVLTPEHLERALSLFLEGTLSAAEVEAWANAVECREDLALSEPLVDEVLNELANPSHTHPFSEERAQDLLSVLALVDEGE